MPDLNPFPDYPDVELHNIVELDSSSGYPGALVRRIPRQVAARLEQGVHVAQDAQLCELRFVATAGTRLAVTLTSLAGGDLFVYRGDFVHTHVRLPAGQLYRHQIEHGPDPFVNLRPEAFVGQAFDRQVWRVMLDGPTLLHGLDRMDSVIRPPLTAEKPAVRWLAYGSSITHGYTPVSRRQSYVAQTARRLGVDVLNLGLSGACLCEPSLAEYLAGRRDWDFITCELGVNMRNRFSPDAFAGRARHLVSVLSQQRPGCPVVLISPFTTAADFRISPTIEATHTAGYREALRTIAAEFSERGVTLIEGTELLPEFAGLTCDLVHPSTEGHTLLAENLAQRLSALGIPGARRHD
jgi:lysophospholipase L1-like esterase